MIPSLELLFHYRCDRCDGWWSIADLPPREGEMIRCPHCGVLNSIEEVVYPSAKTSPERIGKIREILQRVTDGLGSENEWNP